MANLFLDYSARQAGVDENIRFANQFDPYRAQREQQIQAQTQTQSADFVSGPWSEDVPPPEFHGVGDYSQVRDRMFQESMAGVSDEMSRRGLMSSSMYGQAAAAAASQAEAVALELERVESARRTDWDLQRWVTAGQLRHQKEQLALQARSLSMQAAQSSAALRQQKQLAVQEMKLRWDMHMGTLDQRQKFALMDRIIQGTPPDEPPQEQQQQTRTVRQTQPQAPATHSGTWWEQQAAEVARESQAEQDRQQADEWQRTLEYFGG